MFSMAADSLCSKAEGGDSDVAIPDPDGSDGACSFSTGSH